MRFLLHTAILLIAFSCSQPEPQLKTGTWRGVIKIQGQELPFNFEVQRSGGTYIAYIKNGREKILLDEITVDADSLSMVLHIFDATFKAAIKKDSLTGHFIINYTQGYRLPFAAAFGQSHRFIPVDTTVQVKDFSGKYDVQFFNESNTVQALGIITQKGNYAEGTFLTPTGDYRYLEGSVVNDTLCLSTFDGNHLYLFNAAKLSDSTLQGTQWLGRSRSRKWTGIRNEDARPPATESLTYLKEGYDRLEFSFPDVDGVMISPQDARFKNKVLVIQLMGTWCPNCMDETRFLSGWYSQNKTRGIEVIALAYEQKDNFNYASERVRKMKRKLGVEYDVLIAGVSDNAKASKTLPALNQVVAFPTTIFVGKDGKVKHINTGFSGPGTGIYYEQAKARFNQVVNACLSE